MTTHAGNLASPATPASPRPQDAPPVADLEDYSAVAAERGRRNLALLIGVTTAVLVFGLAIFAWMYGIVGLRG